MVVTERGTRFFPWAGSKVHTTLWAFACSRKLTVTADKLSLIYSGHSLNEVLDHFREIQSSTHSPMVLAEFLPMKTIQKFDTYLSEELLDLSNSRRMIDLKMTLSCLASV